MPRQLPLGSEPVKRVKKGQKVIVRTVDGKLRSATVSDTSVTPRAWGIVDCWVRYDREPKHEYGVIFPNVYTVPEGS